MKFIPKVIVLRTAGTNCDVETAFAFSMCGANKVVNLTIENTEEKI